MMLCGLSCKNKIFRILPHSSRQTFPQAALRYLIGKMYVWKHDSFQWPAAQL